MICTDGSCEHIQIFQDCIQLLKVDILTYGATVHVQCSRCGKWSLLSTLLRNIEKDK